MKNKNGFSGAAILIWLVVFAFSVYGWVMNIVKLLDAGPLVTWAAEEIIRCIGIFLGPLGVVMGYL